MGSFLADLSKLDEVLGACCEQPDMVLDQVAIN